MNKNGHIAYSGTREKRTAFVFALLLCLAVLAVYYSSLKVPFIFDGRVGIENNQSIRHLWPLNKLLHGSSRPLVKFSFALNYAFNRLNVESFHVVNIGIHLLAALILFGLVRRTFTSPRFVFSGSATFRDWTAFAAALIWAVHPIQTESVTYIYQRSESLTGMFYLLTVYALSRGIGSGKSPGKWYVLSLFSCIAGIGCKAIMITAPVTALVYDRIFWAGSWGEIWRKRRNFYILLALTWFIPVLIAFGNNESSSTVGSGLQYTTPLSYACVQPAAILYYLRLVFWPDVFILDYGWPFVSSLSCGIFPALAVFVLAGLSVWLLFRRPQAGFLCFWFFFILAPTSSFFPIADPLVEHRMYLPLAAICVGAALAVSAAAVRYVKDQRRRRSILVIILSAVFLLLGARTVKRNIKYQNRLAIWHDVTIKCPNNLHGHAKLARILADRGEFGEAMVQFNLALHGPNGDQKAAGEGASFIHYNLAVVLEKRGDIDGAIEHYRKAVELKPDNIDARNNLAMLLTNNNRSQDALYCLLQAVNIDPDNAQLYVNIGTVLEDLGRHNEASRQYLYAIALDPDCAEAYNNLGVFLASQGRLDKAVKYLERAHSLTPEDDEIKNNLAEAENELKKSRRFR